MKARSLAMAGEPEGRGPKATALRVNDRAAAPSKGAGAAVRAEAIRTMTDKGRIPFQSIAGPPPWT